jgi:hypothetical protein
MIGMFEKKTQNYKEVMKETGCNNLTQDTCTQTFASF